ncbi:MAG: hypothetical protein E7606_04790 [Ruminococcaceae bacterium]|nr:hypothetical protein [Oscillospiraceae bacterium]
MFSIRIADITVEIQNRYHYISELCEEYKVEGESADFSVSATEANIDEELSISETAVPRAYAEATCIHRQIARKLAQYDAFLLHSAVISCDGVGYAFAARSGTGKSTHIALWMKNFGSRVRVVNGDKPILRFIDGKFHVYGTPWRGKECLGENTSCILEALCFLERGAKNEIVRVTKDEALVRLFSQVYLPEDAEASAATLDLLDTFMEKTRFYLLHCNMEDEAALVSYEGMHSKKENEK